MTNHRIVAITPLITFGGNPRQTLNLIEDLAHLEKTLGELCPEFEELASALNESYTHYQFNRDEPLESKESEIRNSILEDLGEVGVRQVPNGVASNVEFDSEA